jgi:hypothetical protein
MGILLGVVIVDTMADYSRITPAERQNNQQIGHVPNHAFNASDREGDEPILNSNDNKGSALRNMLMIGLTLVGLASFREVNKH